jgi:hypothetical protein
MAQSLLISGPRGAERSGGRHAALSLAWALQEKGAPGRGTHGGGNACKTIAPLLLARWLVLGACDSQPATT